MSDPLAQPQITKPAATIRGEAEAVAAHFPALLVEAGRLAATIIVGEHGRRQAGMGEDFWQFRHFREGDGRSVVDWRRSARTHGLFVRENEREAAQTVWLWCDPSQSMRYKSNLAPVEKADRAQVLSLALALLLTRAGERIGNLAYPDKARRGEIAVRLVAQAMQSTATSAFPNPSPKFARSTIVMVSDFLAPTKTISGFIAQVAGGHTQGHLVQVLDPAEETWPFEGRMLFEGANAERLLAGRAQSLRGEYCARLKAHRDTIRAACRRVGWSFTVHHTDTRPEPTLLGLYAQLSGQAEIVSSANGTQP